MATLRRALVDVGLRLAELRTNQRATQAELAEWADLSLRYVQMIEAGHANPTFDVFHALARALDVEVHSLFEAPPAPRARKRLGRPKTRG